jgi:hypothetical protein
MWFRTAGKVFFHAHGAGVDRAYGPASAAEGVRCSEPLHEVQDKPGSAQSALHLARALVQSGPATGIRKGFWVEAKNGPGVGPSMDMAARNRGSGSTPRSDLVPRSE